MPSGLSGAPIRCICLSDLHLGALNSMLTNVTDDQRVDQGEASPVLHALCAALTALRRPGDDPPELVILGDLFELALSTLDDAAAVFGQFVSCLRPGADGAAVSANVRVVAGNHDHHLWTRARDEHYMEYLSRLAPSEPLRPQRHATALLPEHDPAPVRDRFVELLARRAGFTLSVVQSYPNLGMVTPDGSKAVVLSHGHFLEPLYRLMSEFDRVFGSSRPGPVLAADLEADNGSWIDFFWSSMADSGDMSASVRRIYESLQSEPALAAEVQALRLALRKGRPRLRSWLRAEAVAGALQLGTARGMLRERHQPVVISRAADEGLVAYLEGPVAEQLKAEGLQPEAVTFVFGHTHKPFVRVRTADGLPGEVPVVNTGGWVVDCPDAEPLKGAAIVVVDADLHVAVIRCYQQSSDGSSYRVEVQSATTGVANPLADDLRAVVDPARPPWATLAETAAAARTERAAQLAARLAPKRAAAR